MKELYHPFCSDIIQNCYSSDISYKEIEKQIQKHSKDTFVKTMDDSLYDIRNPKALFSIEMERTEDECGTHINMASKTIFLNLPKNISEFARFIAELAHEMTHAFQQEADDRLSFAELFEMYAENADKEEVINTLRVMDDIFIELEYQVNKEYEKQTDLKDFIETNLALQLIDTKPKINYSMLLDYCILRARNEEEAYLNMQDFMPDSSAQYKTQIYDLMASSLYKIAKEYRGK